jgi:two-component system, OmpR family, phosphate regulon response regulator OmpR
VSDEAPHLLVVDDDERLRGLLSRYLVENGFRVTGAGDAAEARLKLKSFDFDLLVVDVMMPGENGFVLTQSVKAERRVPILLLTALAEPEQRIHGLEQGADDFLAKPFEPRELVLRIRNVLQRSHAAAQSADEFYLGAFRFDLKRGELMRGEELVHLTQAEAALLSVLVRRVGTPVSRDELAEQANFSGNVRTVDVQMTRLRRKIERDPKYPRYLQTVRGTGYVLKPD